MVISPVPFVEVSVFLFSFLFSLANRRAGYIAIAISSLLVAFLSLIHPSPLNMLKTFASISWFLLSLTSRDRMSPMVSLSIAGMMVFMDSSNFFVLITGWELMVISLFYCIKGLKGSITFLGIGELSTLLLIVGASIAGRIEDVGLVSGVLLLSGFLVKTGVTPFYSVDWLPIQDGRLPHSVSGLISATMTLMGVYGALEVLMLIKSDIVGYLLIILGGLTAFMASLYGYVSDDGRASLAFSSVENSGAMVTALGVYALGGVTQGIALASLIMIALSNSIGKTGAFLNPISSLTYSSPLLKRVQSYAGAVMIASSLSGLLPTAGGVGSWALLESLFIDSYLLGLGGVIPLVGGVFIALAEGFATALIVKYISSRHLFREGREQDEDWLPRLISGIIVVTSGVSLSYLVFPDKGGLLGVAYDTLILTYSNKPFGGISPLYVLLVAGIGTLLTILVLGRPKGRRVNTWNNGVRKEEDYTPFAMANNERTMLRMILGNGKFSRDIFLSFFVFLARKYKGLSDALARLVLNGSLNIYVAYLLVTFLIFLIIAILS